MSEEFTNIDNPLNARHDEEERNLPHVTPIPASAEADDLFDDTVEAGENPDFPSPREVGERPGPRP